ncbi:MAG: RNA 2',3'-cyclic phosphodiesterase [Candidatus Marsarchaeota archaeon]|nr:RNA 2',3'-cyclic phosphodiesterase [Candidatus Marsarchaeota archaeon]
MGTRAFISVEIPDEIKEGILKVSKELRNEGIRFVPKSQLHITLYFFESLNDEQIEMVEGVMDDIDIGEFDIALAGFGTFTRDKPRVLFVNAFDNGTMANMYDAMKSGFSDLGIGEPEERAFVPHLTVGRVKIPTYGTKQDIDKFIAKHGKAEFGEFACDSIRLIKSMLASDGPVHEEIYMKTLKEI